MLSLAGAYADLVYHVLAHVQVLGPSSLHDERYLAWSRASLESPARRPAENDARALGVRYARAPGADLVHALPALHASVAGFCASATKALHELLPADVADAELLRALLEMDRPLVEILRCAMALSARAYARAHAGLVEPELRFAAEVVAPLLGEATGVMPALRHFSVELSHPLGPRGRVFGRRILVGAPVSWCDLPPPHPVLQAMHECAVACAERELRSGGSAPLSAVAHVASEWRALCAVEQLIQSSSWQEWHVAWRAGLATAALEAEARRLGVDRDVGSLVAALRR